jgi:hypothetical protein
LKQAPPHSRPLGYRGSREVESLGVRRRERDALFFVNALIFARATGKMGQMAVEVDTGERPVEEVVAAMAASNPGRNLLLGNATIFALLILDMVLKPL